MAALSGTGSDYIDEADMLDQTITAGNTLSGYQLGIPGITWSPDPTYTQPGIGSDYIAEADMLDKTVTAGNTLSGYITGTPGITWSPPPTYTLTGIGTIIEYDARPDSRVVWG